MCTFYKGTECRMRAITYNRRVLSTLSLVPLLTHPCVSPATFAAPDLRTSKGKLQIPLNQLQPSAAQPLCSLCSSPPCTPLLVTFMPASRIFFSLCASFFIRDMPSMRVMRMQCATCVRVVETRRREKRTGTLSRRFRHAPPPEMCLCSRAS